MVAEGDDEDTGPKKNRANLEDEFLRHDKSGAYIRNPLLEKERTLPITIQEDLYSHNCLDETLADWHCIKVTESAFREMTGGGGPSPPVSPGGTAFGSTFTRAALNRLRDLPSGYEFAVGLRKSSYVPPRGNRRRPKEDRVVVGTLVDKLNAEVSDVGGALRVECISEGLISAWNRAHPALLIRPGDHILRVNEKARDGPAMLEELSNAPDGLKLIVRRPPPESRAGSSMGINNNKSMTLLPQSASP